MALTWAYKIETLPLDDTTDAVIHLPVPAGGTPWQPGTTATLAIYLDGHETHTFALDVTSTAIRGRIESDEVATISRRAHFKLWASVPGEGSAPSTEVPLYAGRIVREL